jgi:NAD(P)-dependent dehydrogenase (short-subunit alcohol dehydrogenase family)
VAAEGIRVEPGVDVTSDEAVSALAQRLEERGERLDWLISNAGIMIEDELGRIDFAGMRRQFEINAIGPLRVIQALLPLLREGSKVGIITSRVGSLGDNTSGGLYGYRMSKAAANMAGVNLHHDLSKRGIAVLMLHPGMVDTELTAHLPKDRFAFISADEAAAGLVRAMDALTLAESGRFQHGDGQWLPF